MLNTYSGMKFLIFVLLIAQLKTPLDAVITNTLLVSPGLALRASPNPKKRSLIDFKVKVSLNVVPVGKGFSSKSD
jgi:hypothetical protein